MPVAIQAVARSVSSPASQASWLNDPRLSPVQRQAIAASIARRQGNSHLQKIMASLKPGEQAEGETVQELARSPAGAWPSQTWSLTVQRQNAPAQDIMRPETFPTYEGWLEAFYTSFLSTPEQRRANTFESRDTARAESFSEGDLEIPTTPTSQTVLGQRAASPEEAPEMVGRRASDRFVDHATDDWVRAHLPERLRQTAYQLPSDCADMAVILRHVWVASHGRSETYRGWRIGYLPGGLRQEQRQVHEAIGAAFSGNVRSMVNAYSDAQGRPIRSVAILQSMLHPGDILVWEHHERNPLVRSGGHTQTISHIDRDDTGRIASMTVLQGNQPIHKRQAQEIRKEELQEGRQPPSEAALRSAPGRRIEVETYEGGGPRGDLLVPSDFEDLPEPRRAGSVAPEEMVWTWGDGHTRLVAAGPPAAASRPPMQRRRGEAQARRRLGDWTAPLRSATADNLPGRFEAALLEARAMIEGGQRAGLAPVSEEEARELGRAAGEALWKRARSRARQPGTSTAGRRMALGDESHYRALAQMQAMLTAMRSPGLTPQVRTTFDLIEQEFIAAARGASSITFERAGAARDGQVNILLTGFDPFNTDPSQRGQPPARGTWNPSGAAVLALDGTSLSIPHGPIIAVEGIVLPVSFEDFGEGMVERFVRPHLGAADAVITVSMSPNIAPGGAVRIERYAVNAHLLDNGEMQVISGVGPAIIPSPAPTQEIAAATGRPRRGDQPAIAQPDIGREITFRFSGEEAARRVRLALGQPAAESQGSPELANPFADEVQIGDPAIAQIFPTIQRLDRSPGLWVSFRINGQGFQGEIISGPGGSYLSNEVSYRVLSLLNELPEGERPVSFHVHTPRGGNEGSSVPPEPQSGADRDALRTAMEVRATLIDTLRQMIRAVARQLGSTGGE